MIGQIPSKCGLSCLLQTSVDRDFSLLITRIRPSLWVNVYPEIIHQCRPGVLTRVDDQIPAMELMWSILTLVLASSKSFTTLVVIRFFVGLAESTFYPGMQVSTRLHVPRYRNETCYESMLLAVGIRKKN